MRRNRAYEFALGVVFLAAGSLVYVVSRGPSLGQVPSFAHALAFSLMTAATFGPGRRAAALACATWGVGDALLEVGQSSWLGHPLAGRFDGYDVLAGIAGSLAAYILLDAVRRAERAWGVHATRDAGATSGQAVRTLHSRT